MANKRISQNGLNLIMKFEGCRLQAYRCAAGVWTIGYGHTAGVSSGMKITRAQAEEYLKQDCRKFENYVNNKTYVPVTEQLNQNQFDALVSFAFNCGQGNLKKLCSGRTTAQIAAAIPKYNKAAGKVLSGLVRRRAAEQALFHTEAADRDDSKTPDVSSASAQNSGEGHYPKYTGSSGSITEALAAVGEKDTSKGNRAKIAAANNIADYNFTAEQNAKMVKLLKAGTLKRADAGTDSGNASYYPKYTGASSSIVISLAAVGEKDTSIAHRKKIAETNGISGYTGTAAQNTSMLNLLKSGKLRKA